MFSGLVILQAHTRNAYRNWSLFSIRNMPRRGLIAIVFLNNIHVHSGSIFDINLNVNGHNLLIMVWYLFNCVRLYVQPGHYDLDIIIYSSTSDMNISEDSLSWYSSISLLFSWIIIKFLKLKKVNVGRFPTSFFSSHALGFVL